MTEVASMLLAVILFLEFNSVLRISLVLLTSSFLVFASLWRVEFHSTHQRQGTYKLSLAPDL